MECNQCHKVFTRSDNLRRHMKIHERSPNLSQSRPSNCAMKSVIDGIIDRAVLPLKDEIRNYMAKCHRFDENERGSLGASRDKLNIIIQQNKDEDNTSDIVLE